MTAPRIALWCAVSSTRQAAPDKTSLEDQEASGREFAAAVGGDVVRVYRVPGHSRDYVLWSEVEADIPAYRELREDVESRAFDVLYALDVDRLGRDPALCEQVRSLVERAGAEVYVAATPHTIGQSSMGHRYVYAIQAVRAKEMQEIRVARQARGMRGRVARGLPCAWPVGYESRRDSLSGTVVGATFGEGAPAVRLATRLYLEGMPYEGIVELLNRSPWSPPRGRQWYNSTVWDILHNDIYAGYVRWGDHRAERPSELFPAFWDEETYGRILHQRADRKRRYGHRHGSPLRGVVFCARCGTMMIRTRGQRAQEHSLTCGRQQRKSRTGLPCHPNRVREAEALMRVVELLREVADPAALERALEGQKPNETYDQELGEIEDALKEAEGKRRRIALALAAGSLDTAMYRTTDDSILEHVEKLHARRAVLLKALAAQPDPEQQRAAILTLTATLDSLHDREPGILSAILRQARIRIEAEANRIVFVGFT